MQNDHENAPHSKSRVSAHPRTLQTPYTDEESFALRQIANLQGFSEQGLLAENHPCPDTPSRMSEMTASLVLLDWPGNNFGRLLVRLLWEADFPLIGYTIDKDVGRTSCRASGWQTVLIGPVTNGEQAFTKYVSGSMACMIFGVSC